MKKKTRDLVVRIFLVLILAVFILSIIAQAII